MGQLTIEGERNMTKCKEAKKLLPAAVAWSLLLSTTSLFFVFTARWFSEIYTIWVPVGEAFIALIVIANFTLATFMDPGVIPKASRGEDNNDDLRAPLYKTVEVQGTTVRMKWCVTCQFYRPPRCSHCSVCNNCIETFDHHCPWVNNCIGRRNYRFFFMFLLSLSFHMIAIFSVCLVHILHEMERNMSALPVIISISIMVVICILFIPIFGLTCFHIILVSRGRTTNEQVTGKYRGGFNPFSRGCCFNCWFTLCGPQYPGLVKAKKIASKNNTAAVIYHPSKSGGGGPGSASGNQVKVYVDNGKYSKSGNLPTLHSPRNYRQMMPSSNRDMSDQEFGGLQASQSLDCEPTPPMQRHDGSKNNFFLPSSSHQDDNSSLSHLRHVSRGQYHGSPHPNRQRRREQSRNAVSGSLGQTDFPNPDFSELSSSLKSGDIVRSRSQTPDSLSSPSDQVIGPMDMPSPTLQQKIRAIGGIPTPFTVSASPLTRRSNPPTPTSSNHGIRPDFMGFSQPSMIRQQPYYEHYGGGGPVSNNGEQRRFLSESELLYERERDYHSGLGGGGLLRDASGQIRELASSPQRGNMYNWKECSPTTANVPMSNNFSHVVNVNPTSSSSSFYHSNPTSPIQQNILNNSANNSNNRGGGGGICYHQTSLGYNTPPAYTIGNKPPQLQQSSIPQQQQQQLSPIMKKKMYSSLNTGSNSSGIGIIGTSGNSGTDVRPSPISRPNISRPMSFVKALEMTDSIEMNNRSANNMNSPAGTPKVQPQMSLSDRASVYDINYEISV